MATFYKSGDKSRAMCGDCDKLVSTTFGYRDVPFDDGSGTVPNILAGVCDDCGGVVSIPAQSTAAIRRARETATIPLEVRLPAREVELLDLAAYTIAPEATARLRKPLIAFFLYDLMGQADAWAQINRDLPGWLGGLYPSTDDPPRHEPKRRISIKLSPKTDRLISEGMRASGLDKTGLMHAVIMRATLDVLDRPVPEKIERLREIARIVNA